MLETGSGRGGLDLASRVKFSSFHESRYFFELFHKSRARRKNKLKIIHVYTVFFAEALLW